MSFFATYSPERLWKRTLYLLNNLFIEKPNFDSSPKSYFVATIEIHNIVLQDLSEVFKSTIELDNSIPTIGQIYTSLTRVEQVLLGKNSSKKYKQDIRGCCLYTDHLSNSLYSYHRTCHIL